MYSRAPRSPRRTPRTIRGTGILRGARQGVQRGRQPRHGSPVELSRILQAKPSYYFHDDGSLTGPDDDCTRPDDDKVTQLVTGNFPEAANGYVLGDAKTLSKASITKMLNLFPEGNARSRRP